MLLSYDRRFLFIHIDKVAGSSIQLALQPYALQQKGNRLRKRLVWLRSLNRIGNLYRVLNFPEHVTARSVKNCLPPVLYESLFKFAFVRNPWDRLVSRYAFLLGTVGHPEHRLVKAMKSFEDYLQWEIRRGQMFQRDYVVDPNGKVIVDFIGFYESLEEDFARVCMRLGVEALLPRDNASNHRDYRTYYTSAARDLVAHHFRCDAELFGYDFDGLSAKSSNVKPPP